MNGSQFSPRAATAGQRIRTRTHDRNVQLASLGRAAGCLAAVWLTLAGCDGAGRALPEGAGDRGAPDAAPAAFRLCNGGSDAELTFLTGGGGRPRAFHSFYAANGELLLVIDGSCRYWAGEHYTRGLRTGQLSEAQAAAIARDARLGELSVIATDTGTPYPDGSGYTIATRTQIAYCSGSCKRAENQKVYDHLLRIQRELFDAGEPAPVPIQVVATAGNASGRTPLSWTLPWSPAEVIVSADAGALAGRLVTDAAEVAYLRGLREQIERWSVVLVAVDGQPFHVYPRDVAPPAVAAAIQSLLGPFRR
jgi:hypothetical protein